MIKMLAFNTTQHQLLVVEVSRRSAMLVKKSYVG